MCITILKPENFSRAQWSGGTTTQLYIYPADAVYAQRNFLFRLSTALVEAERSEFTSLSGISRHLMVLNGAVTVNHKDHYSKTLRKFDTDSFEGGWHTTAEGTCTDFNLMLCGKTTGKLSALTLNPGETQNTGVPTCGFFFVYAFSGEADIGYNSANNNLTAKHLLVLKGHTPGTLTILSRRGAELVMVEVRL